MLQTSYFSRNGIQNSGQFPPSHLGDDPFVYHFVFTLLMLSWCMQGMSLQSWLFMFPFSLQMGTQQVDECIKRIMGCVIMEELWDALSWKNYGMCYHGRIMGCIIMKELWVVLTWRYYGMCYHERIMGCIIMEELWDALTWRNYGMCYHKRIMGCVISEELWDVWLHLECFFVVCWLEMWSWCFLNISWRLGWIRPPSVGGYNRN